MRTLAAVAWKAGAPLEIEEIDVDLPRGNEVMVRMLATSVCHTDSYTLSGADPEGKFPCILGHEGIGRVEQVGPDVKTTKVGDLVIPLYIPECRECKFCRSGLTNLCQSIRSTQGQGLMPDGTSRFSKDGTPILHYMGTSTFSELTVMPEISVAVVPPTASHVALESLCLLGCGVTTGVGAVLNTAKVRPNSTIAVFGLGGIGLSVIQGAKIAKAKRIIAVDINERKFKVATELGATDTLNPASLGKPIEQAIVEMTDGGVDYSFECIGQPSTMRAALECCHKGWGESTIIGVAASGEEISTRPFQLVTGRVWRGTAFGGVKGRSELPSYIDRAAKGEIQLRPLVTEELAFSQIGEAFQSMKEGRSIRTILRF